LHPGGAGSEREDALSGTKVCSMMRVRPSASSDARGFSVVVIKLVSLLLAAAAVLVVESAPVIAQDTLKIAVPQRGAWDTSITEIGNRAGIFKKHGVNAELLFTGGGAEALGAIIGGSIDGAVSVGISTVLGSFSKGAPVRVFSAETTGQPDIYWFVPAQSPIRSVADFKDKTIGY
jgi:NitT/TauT family transport system substrate-binding protein